MKSRTIITHYKPPRRRQTGFTLIELLVVVIIIGVLLTYATISVSVNSDERLEQEARRLATVVRLANEEAIINGRDIVLRFSKRNYEFGFFQLGENNAPEWAPVEADDPVLATRGLPDDISLRLLVEGEEMSLGTETDDEERPGIMLMASGEITPFQVSFINDDADTTLLVEGDAGGNVFYRGAVE